MKRTVLGLRTKLLLAFLLIVVLALMIMIISFRDSLLLKKETMNTKSFSRKLFPSYPIPTNGASAS